MKRRDFVTQGTLAGLGIWFSRPRRKIVAVLARYGTAKYNIARYGR